MPATATSRRIRTAAGRLLQAGIVKRAETRQLLATADEQRRIELLDVTNRAGPAVSELREAGSAPPQGVPGPGRGAEP